MRCSVIYLERERVRSVEIRGWLVGQVRSDSRESPMRGLAQDDKIDRVAIGIRGGKRDREDCVLGATEGTLLRDRRSIDRRHRDLNARRRRIALAIAHDKFQAVRSIEVWLGRILDRTPTHR